MKTNNRPTAHVRPVHTVPAGSLAGLTTRARRLWTLDLGVVGRQREDRLTELAELDLTIERLSIRAASGLFSAVDGALAEQCRRTLNEFERTWTHPLIGSPTLDEATADAADPAFELAVPQAA